MGRRKKRRAYKRNDPEWLAKKQAAVWAEGEVRQRAAEAGLVLRVNVVECGRTETLHWMFRAEADDFVVLHYWPTRGSYRSGLDETRGVAAGPFEALGLAKDLLARRELAEAGQLVSGNPHFSRAK